MRLYNRRITFYFHYADCLELCLKNEATKNKFHVVHCSDYSDRVGFSALIPAASECLLEDTPEADLLTESISWAQLCSLEKPYSFIQYVECVFGCPLSLIPTIYSVRLTNHLLLGNCNVSCFHDDTFYKPITLKWVKATPSSNNVKLDHTPSSFEEGFFKPWSCVHLTSTEYNQANCELKDRFFILHYSPLTYYNVLQSLIKRCVWVEDAAESLFLDALLPPLRLTWIILQAWIKGDAVRLFTCPDSSRMKRVLKMDHNTNYY